MRKRPSSIFLQAVAALALGSILLTAGAASAGLKVYSSSMKFGPFDLEGDSLQQLPGGIEPFGFEEPVWVIGYQSSIVDSEGEPVDDELRCHTMLRTPVPSSWMGRPTNGIPFKGFFSDAYNKKLVLPQGFGIFVDVGEELDMAPMFNNRADVPVVAGLEVTVFFVRDADLEEPLVPLFTTVASIVDPHMYMVPPGGDVRESRYRFPYSGVIRALGIHLHPFGRSLELINETKAETVWKGVGVVGENGRLAQMPFLSKPEGYAFSPDDSFVLRAVYDNPTDVEQDAMAGFFIFFSTEDGEFPPAPQAQLSAEPHGTGPHSQH